MPFVGSIALALTRNIPRIFVYHRFDERGELGISKDAFQWQLSVIKDKFHAMTLSEYIEQEQRGKKREKPAVIITVDDGYRDFYKIAYPLLAQYKMPATLFVTTKFVDGEMWFWWDKIRYILNHGAKKIREFNYNNTLYRIDSASSSGIETAWHKLCDSCLPFPEHEKPNFIQRLGHSMEVIVPDAPPKEFAPMTWDEVIKVSKDSVEIGSHTLSHPVLTNIDIAEAKEEIEQSKKSIEEQTGFEAKVFCYPHGRLSDYNQQISDLAAKAGYQGAVVAHDGIFCRHERFALKRMSPSVNCNDFLWMLYGIKSITKKGRCYYSKIKKAAGEPINIYRYLISVSKGRWYKFKYGWVLKRAKFGKALRVQGQLIIKGPGKVIFGDGITCSGRVTPFTHSKNAVILIGNGVFLNGTRFGSACSIKVGPKCILGDCRIMDTDFHSIRKDRHSKDAPVGIGPITIEENVWIGAQAAVLKGVTIGENSVIGFGSVVTSDIEPNVIAAGNPAQVVKKIDSEDPCREGLKSCDEGLYRKD